MLVLVSNWPVFLICLTIAVGAGITYNKYTIPKYVASTSFLIKGAEGGSPNSGDLVDQAINGKQPANLNNEMLTITSSGLLQRTVAKNNFNISYFRKGRILTTNIYHDAPFRLLAKRIKDSSRTYILQLTNLDFSGGFVFYGPERKGPQYPFHWNVPFSVEGQTFILVPDRRIESNEGPYSVQWQPISDVASYLGSTLNVRPFDSKTSVLELSIKTENLNFGKDVLNALFKEFHGLDIEERDKLSESTIRFVDERLLAISNELQGVEGSLENYQGVNQLIDIRGQSSQYLENSNAVSKAIRDISIQQNVVSMIREYFSGATSSNKLVPSSLGISDATLASLIAQYNDLQLKIERETPVVGSNSTVIEDLSIQRNSLKTSIFESLRNITNNLQLQEANLQEQSSQFRSLLASIPHNERVLQEIKRKQSITEGLYLYLLQKREEVALSSTAMNVSHYKQIDLATGYGPVEPNSRNVLLYSTLLGLIAAFGWLYIRHLLNDRLDSRDEVTERTHIPLIGQIVQLPKAELNSLSVLERNIAGEQFRAIRTNLMSYLKEEGRKVILVTSCVSGEGKSFTSLNLAAVCAAPGKRVALLEFDTSKPMAERNPGVAPRKGLTDFLTGQTKNLSDLARPFNGLPTLDIYSAGTIKSYTADILMNDNLSDLFKLLKGKYDLIIIDTPPAELVSDAFILGEYSDIVLFVIRRGITFKKQLDYISEVDSTGKFKNSMLVFNGVKRSRRYLSKQYGYYRSSDRLKESAFQETN